ncbi:MAG: GPR endopeptidase [Eubacteriales bacterium]
MKNDYIRTDLACEAGAEAAARPAEKRVGYDYCERVRGEVSVAELDVRDGEGERATGKSVGRYVTLGFPNMLTASDDVRSALIDECAAAVRTLVGDARGCVMAAGLGNREMTPDALGPLCIDSISVTRHFKHLSEKLFSSLGRECVCALEPGVLARTGIETAETLSGAVENVRPTALIAIDALAARSSDRLMRTVQLSDAGISPGAGVGNRRAALSRDTLGIPVIAIGVPTVVDSSTIVYDALETAGQNDISPELEKVLETGRSYFVSPKDIDEQIETLADIIAEAINKAMEKQPVN